MSVYGKLASAVYNNVVGGLRGYHQTMNMSVEQIEDAVVNERLAILKEYILKGVIPRKDLLMSLNCVPVDCESLDRCPCGAEVDECDELVAHFEIPQVSNDFGFEGIEYVGSTDRMNPYIIYSSPYKLKYNKYRKRGKNKPFAFIDTTPNSDNMNDGYIFNAPLLKMVSVVFIPKDPRQLSDYDCCNTEEIDNMTFINNEVEKRLTEKYLRWYR